MGEEKRFEAYVKRILSDRGAWVLKTWGGGYQRAGIPDLLACYKGEFIAIELKAEKGKVSKLQLLEIERIRKAGGHAMVLRPSQIKNLILYLFLKMIMN